MVYDLFTSKEEEKLHDLWYAVKDEVLAVGTAMDYEINQQKGSHANSMYDLNNRALDEIWTPLNVRTAVVQRALEEDI